MPTTGQFFYAGIGDATDARIAYINSDTPAQFVVVDNNPTTDLITGLVQDIALDTAAGFYFAIVNGGDGAGARLVRGSIANGGPATVVANFVVGNDAGDSNFDDILVNSLHVDSINERIYVGYQDPSGGLPGSTGIRQYSYNPLNGAVTDLGFLVTVTSSGKPQESGFDILNARDFDLDPTTGQLFFTELLTGGVQANGIFRLNTASPNTITQVVSQAQFPDSGSNAFIIDLEVDSSTDLLYFNTQSLTPFGEVGYNAAQNQIWYINQNASGGNATQLTVTGLPGGSRFYGGDMVFDQVARQIYIESEESNGSQIDDVVYVLQLDAAGTSASLVRTISPSPAFTNVGANFGGFAFNNIPVLTGIAAANNAANEQGSAVVLLSVAPTITDFDGDHLSSASVQITGGTFVSNENSTADDRLAVGSGLQSSGLIAGTNITVAYDISTETLTLTGYDTFVNYQAALAAVRYFALGDNPTNYGANQTRTLTWTVSDGALNVSAGSQNSATSIVTINAVNDAPVNGLIAAPTMSEDETFAFVGGNKLSVSDVDANPASAVLTVTLSVGQGTLSLGSTAGLSFSVGDGTADAAMTFTGTANAINAALTAGLNYTPTLNYTGLDTLSFTTSDGGATGGGVLSDIDSIVITVNPINDPPTVSGPVTLAPVTDNDFGLSVGNLLTNASDIDGDILGVSGLTYSFVAPTLNGSDLAYATSQLAATVAVNFAAGTVAFNPRSFDGLLVGDSATLTFNYNVTDGAFSTAQTASVVINGADDGTAGDDIVTGRDGVDDLLRAGNGNDTIMGLSGNDVILGEDGDDLLSGGDGNDVIVGGIGNDRIAGGSGLNQLIGGSGDDQYMLDLRSDSIVESAGGGYDTVRTSTTVYVLASNVEELAYTGSARFIGIGNTSDNVINGGTAADHLGGLAGNDQLFGGTGGANTLVGGIGDDAYFIDAQGDSAIEFAGEGTDTVVTSLAVHVLRVNVENLVYDGGGAFLGIGNAENNVFTGGSGLDFLSGMSGNDTFIGGDGNDELLGGAGADQFLFRGGETGIDRIFDFISGSDTIGLSDGGFTHTVVTNFVTGTGTLVAPDTNSTFFYNTEAGTLSYDADGSGAGAAVVLAILGAGTVLTPGDIQFY